MLKGTKVLFGERLCTYALVGNTLTLFTLFGKIV
jgi:hypothetical protein